ncbi:hypothetical protein [Thiocystis violacea]|uniref:hypothetical protein n=1 Tax=Thiocystis violacea TaxID=13725 RepID=UPI001907015E|nr:hypothetical protein [Thiocystis violacea]
MGRDSVVEFIDAYAQDEQRLLEIILDQETGGLSIRVMDVKREHRWRRISLGRALSLVSRGFARRAVAVRGAGKKI